jgi:hypothetical protein
LHDKAIQWFIFLGMAFVPKNHNFFKGDSLGKVAHEWLGSKEKTRKKNPLKTACCGFFPKTIWGVIHRHRERQMVDFGGKNFRLFSYLIAFQVESVGLILVAWILGGWLESKYPMRVPWVVITFVCAFLGIGKALYALLKEIMARKRELDDTSDREE